MKNNTKRHPKHLTAYILLMGLIIVGYIFYAKINSLPPFANTNSVSGVTDSDIQKLTDEPSESQKENTKRLKDDPSLKVKNDQTDRPAWVGSDTVDEKSDVNVVITSAGVYGNNMEIKGMITNLVTNDGVCEFILRSKTTSDEIRKSTNVLSNVTSTVCETLTIPQDDLKSIKKWTVRISYKSIDRSGTSNMVDVDL